MMNKDFFVDQEEALQTAKRLGKHMGQMVRSIRDEQGISLQQFATITGLSESKLKNIEMGGIDFYVTDIYAIAKGLKVSPAILLDENKKYDLNGE